MEKKVYDAYLGTVVKYINKLDYNQVRNAYYIIRGAIDRGSNIFIVGNGGSMATAMHFAEDLLHGNELKTCVFNLSNISTLSAISNDKSYDEVFLRQLKNLMNKDDLLICISCSGNSRNLINAIDYANDLGETLGISGFNGGYLKKKCNNSIHINTIVGDYEATEDLHLMICHLLGVLLRESVNDNSS